MHVAIDVLRRERDARPLADPEPVVLPILQVAKLGRRRELLVVGVGDARLRERRLQPAGVRPGVLAAADAAALPHVDHERNVGLVERRKGLVEPPAVDANRAERVAGIRHGSVLPRAARRKPQLR